MATMQVLCRFGRGRRVSAPAQIIVCCAGLLCLASPLLAQKTSGNALTTLLGTAQQHPAPATPAQAPAPASHASQPEAIPLPDVAARSEDLRRMLRSLAGQLPTADRLQSAQAALDDRDTELNAREGELDALLQGAPSTLELREQEHFWRSEQAQTSGLRRQLLDWANSAQSALRQVQTQLPYWQATLEQNEHTSGLGPTLDLIRQTVESLEHLKTQSQDQLKAIANLQVRAASQDQLALDTLDRISMFRDSADRRLFERDSPALWQFSQRRELGENPEAYISTRSRLRSLRAFATQVKGALVALVIVLLLSMFGAYRLHLAAGGAQPGDTRRAQALEIVRHWPALGLLPPLLCSYLLAPLAPLPLISLVTLLSFIPILTLLPPLIPSSMRTLLRSLAGVYVISACIAWTGLSAFHKRQLQFTIYFVVIAGFFYLVRRLHHGQMAKNERTPEHKWFVIRGALAVLFVSLLANLFGYVKLSQFLGLLCLYSTFIAISMITGVRVFTLLLLEGVETAAAQRLAAVRGYRDAIVRWVPRLLQTAAALVWAIVTVNLMGLGPWVSDELVRTSEFHIAGGSSGVTLGGVVGFFLILILGYSISSAIRFLLREELLSRLHLARGVPELIASTLHYLLLLLVFFFAVNAGGVELNKFTVLTGALGVGVGFGLQNIVNNFISGLILQFERPIHIGDVLDVDGASGTVTRIGIRSSTIKTFQGAELIIPNGNFVSGKVINWTLTDPRRRVDLPVGVAYGSDLKLVAKLLEQAATTHESVLTSPAPAVYCKEFGDNAINFELQFWVMQESSTTKVKSEVALCAWDLLSNAGIEIPYPQRDLRVRSVSPDAAAALLSSNAASSNYASDLAQADEPKLVIERAQRQRAGD